MGGKRRPLPSSCVPADAPGCREPETPPTAGSFLRPLQTRPDLTHHGAGPSSLPARPMLPPPAPDPLKPRHPHTAGTAARTTGTDPPNHIGFLRFPNKIPNSAGRRRAPRSAAMDDDDAPADASPSPSPSPSPASSPLPVADPVTVAAAPPTGLLTLALPIQKPAASPNPCGGGGREDAWSEGATSALIDAWGERFVALGRGSLRHPQWQEVADAVSSRDGYSKAPKSDIQCKNRIDTLKKKYKIERAKPASSWQFFDRLDVLLAPTYNQKPGGNPNGRNPVPTALRVGFPQRSRTPLMPAAAAVKRRAPSPSPEPSSESSDGFPPEPVLPAANGKRRRTDEGCGDGPVSTDRSQGLRELAQAIRRLGEAYERVETAKLDQAAEMERRRLDFARELESQRVQFFLNTQMELSQVKNHASPAAASVIPAGATAVGGSSRRMASVTDAGTTSNHHGRYRVSDVGRHRHAPRPHYQYHENNVAAAAAAASDGEQSDDEEDDDEDEEESQ